MTRESEQNADLYVWDLKKCWNSFEESAIGFSLQWQVISLVHLNGVQSVTPHISSDSFGSSFSPFTPLTSMLGKVKYETVNCYAICQFIRSLGRQPHFFSYLLPCHIHLQWVCMTQKPPTACGEMPYIVLCWFFSEEGYTFPCCAS